MNIYIYIYHLFTLNILYHILILYKSYKKSQVKHYDELKIFVHKKFPRSKYLRTWFKWSKHSNKSRLCYAYIIDEHNKHKLCNVWVSVKKTLVFKTNFSLKDLIFEVYFNLFFKWKINSSQITHEIFYTW